MALRAPRTDRGLGRPRQRPPDKAAAALGRAKEGAVPRQGALPRLGSARSQDGGCVARSRVEAPPGRASALLRSRDAPFRPSGGYGGAAGTSGALVRPVGGLLAAPVSARGRVPQRLRGLGRGSSWGLRPPSPGLWVSSALGARTRRSPRPARPCRLVLAPCAAQLLPAASCRQQARRAAPSP